MFSGRLPGRALVAILISCVAGFSASSALAAAYYVESGIAQNGASPEDARSLPQLVRNAVQARSDDLVSSDDWKSDYQLRPRLLKDGDSYIVIVEKHRGAQIISRSQSRTTRVADLAGATKAATDAAIEQVGGPLAPEPQAASQGAFQGAQPSPTQAPQPSAAGQVWYGEPPNQNPNQNQGPSGQPPQASASQPPVQAAPLPVIYVAQAQTPAPQPTNPQPAEAYAPPALRSHASADRYAPDVRRQYWVLGLGPFFGHNLSSDSTMYGINGGHNWDINPQIAAKVLAEAAFSSGADSARFFNVAAGANYYFSSMTDGMTYVTGDIGYGYAKTARPSDASEGFSVGAGLGYQFMRFSASNLDLLLRYATITNAVQSGGYPSILGARVAFNF